MKIDCVTLAFIEELINQLTAVSASPGFTWGDSGNINSGTFLLNDTVPSNQAGRMVPLKSGEITKIFVANQDANTFTIEILKRTGPGTFSSLTTVSVVAARTKVETKSGVSVAENDELVCKVSAGSCKNPVVGVIIRGTNA
jgi:hypothetical protein